MERLDPWELRVAPIGDGEARPIGVEAGGYRGDGEALWRWAVARSPVGIGLGLGLGLRVLG
jgi:hypothetical protein